MRAVLVVSWLSLSLSLGCIGWNDVPGAPIRPVAPDEHADSWHAEVEDVVEMWRAAVEPYGCASPFRIALDDPDAHDVRLIPRDEWASDYDPGWAGFAFPDSPWERGYIGVKYNVQDVRMLVLSHELGHAIGLDHSDDPARVMHERNTSPVPDAADGVAAANLLGCTSSPALAWN